MAKKNRISIAVSERTLKELDQLCELWGDNRSQIIIKLISIAFSKEKERDK